MTQARQSKVVLIGLIVICFAIAAAGGLCTSSSVTTWYPTLQKPPYNPPAWIFGPVWSTLYLMIAIAGWDIYRHVGFRSSTFRMYGLQLILNALWSPIFFGLQDPALALIDIAVLWLSIVATVILARKHARLAALLFIPYILWVSFATLLNFEIWQLN